MKPCIGQNVTLYQEVEEEEEEEEEEEDLPYMVHKNCN